VQLDDQVDRLGPIHHLARTGASADRQLIRLLLFLFVRRLPACLCICIDTATGAPDMQDQIRPLPSLTPVAQFRVDRGLRRSQRLACLPDSRGGVQLNVVTRRGFRSVRQWPFRDANEAQRWAEQAIFCGGPFHVY
jgi:hypothetical protein